MQGVALVEAREGNRSEGKKVQRGGVLGCGVWGEHQQGLRESGRLVTPQRFANSHTRASVCDVGLLPATLGLPSPT